MGDAAHTAHFSIDSGTKLALEDAIELACCLREHPDTGDALASYEAVRSVEVLKIQNAARNSTEWFENVDRDSGPKGSTQVGWAEPDEPLPAGNWVLIAAAACLTARPIRCHARCQTGLWPDVPDAAASDESDRRTQLPDGLRGVLLPYLQAPENT